MDKKQIKLHPAPHVELKLHISDEMIKDFKECAEEVECAGFESGKDCKTCSWIETAIGDTCMCELVTLELLEAE